MIRPIRCRLESYLDDAGVRRCLLDEIGRRKAEEGWREVYGQAFRHMWSWAHSRHRAAPAHQARYRTGSKAEYEYLQEICTDFLVITFSAAVPGLPLGTPAPVGLGYQCLGPLVSLAEFADIEFFVSPPDFSWSMIYTHEDDSYGGPYFIRAGWIP